jgi:lipopolysaccharide/colanic/teichoic acid biosynthesis glycosyltransferase
MIRRTIDFVFAVLALPLLSPLFVLVSLAVIVESPGNPFYGGWRAGKDGRRFRMWKFRTMVKNADRKGPAITSRRDPRVTRIGQFLRSTKIDELPQFFNLLVGDLTLIGPRPEAPEFVDQYTHQQRQILEVKPGITGPAQLQYTTLEAETVPDGEDAAQYYLEHLMDSKLRLDLAYIKSRTFRSDCRVVVKTILLMAHALAQAVER